ncbi:MAG: hypothetical protein ABSG64_09835 [Solirubrobacteraceae bacterium]
MIRSTPDIDVCPSGEPGNLERLAALLADIQALRLDVDEEGFTPAGSTAGETSAEDLAAGGNFRFDTSLGVLDVMQWLAGIDEDDPYAELSADAAVAEAFGVRIQICSLAHLRAMKRAAGRARDLTDLADLDAAHSSGR